jgi:spore germination protein YaaH
VTVVPQEVIASPIPITTYIVQEGDTLVAIAVRFDTALQTLAELNPQIDFSDCDFTRLSGGLNCVVSLTVGDTLNVPLHSELATPLAITPTPTPIADATNTADPTPTPSPG